MSIFSAVKELSKRYETNALGNGGVEFMMDGYSVEFHDRGLERLTVTFIARMPEKWKKPATARKGWGYEFLQKKGTSALHVKSDRNTWYRLPSIRNFFEDANSVGFFSAFEHTMTYGTSMGGYGALAFAGIVGANACLSYNPQINLGQSVRSWETRFSSAMQYSWDDPTFNLNDQIRDVKLPVVVYDPYYKLDRKQVELLSGGHVIKLRVPFVGHHMPDHFRALGLLNWMYSECESGEVDKHEFYRRVRERRHLLRYRNVMLSAANGNIHRYNRINRLLPQEKLLGDP
ncbi:hypothetical protein [Paracoccus fontiphilus]|uniref:Uncharacterized protein n=1 Tax=Paracoccus fontiphilus TaxID=1815556 RepID=A0ABV7IMB8_9RHOB|nr:hypothetical protein [Paracoccus fontiphilus]